MSVSKEQKEFASFIVANIEKFIEKSKFKRMSDFLRESDMSGAAFYNMKKAGNAPSLYSAYKMSKALGVSIDDFCGLNNESNQISTNERRAIVGALEELKQFLLRDAK